MTQATNKRPARKRSVAKPAGGVVRTIGALAKFYGVRANTIHSHWLADPDFPGRPDKPGGKNGRFEIDAVDRWLVARERKRTSGQRSQAAVQAAKRLGVNLENTVSTTGRKAEIDLAISILKLERLRGGLVDRDYVQTEIGRVYNLLLQTIRQLPYLLAQIVPVDTPEPVRDDLLKRARIQIDDSLHGFTDLLEADGRLQLRSVARVLALEVDRLQLPQAAIAQALGELAKTHPNTIPALRRFAACLIDFSTEE